jgi:hypothetical protein
MRIIVVGAGWYGCHIASALLEAGHDVVVADAAPVPLAGASGNNQFRLHMGLHYPRSLLTRQQTLDGYHRFLQRYPELTTDIPHNLYAVDARDSLLDFGTFCQVMGASAIPVEPVAAESFGLRQVEGVVRCEEKSLLTENARRHFRKELGAALQLGRRIEQVEPRADHLRVDGEQFDALINTTWFAFRPTPRLREQWYEPTVLFYYQTPRSDLAITVMDGPFCSIYPCGDGRVTLSSVPFTPLGRFADAAAAHHRLDTITTAEIDALRHAMEEQARRYYPAFDDIFTFDGVQRSVKTKLPTGSEARPCFIDQVEREIWVFSGKIDTVFAAEVEVLQRIEALAGMDTAAQHSLIA